MFKPHPCTSLGTDAPREKDTDGLGIDLEGCDRRGSAHERRPQRRVDRCVADNLRRPLPGHPGARIGAPVLRCDARVRELAPCRRRRVGRGEPCHLLAASRSVGGVVGCGCRLRRVEHVCSGMAGATPRGRHVSCGRVACGQRTVLERPATPPGSLRIVCVPGSPRLNGRPELAAAGLRTCGVHTW